jgi:3-methylcrotonyl-CoA carboxylase alpha subunit
MVFRLTVDGRPHEIEILRRRPHLVVSVDGREHEIAVVGSPDDGRQTVGSAGLGFHFTRAHIGDRQIVRLGGANFETSMVDPTAGDEIAGAGRDDVKAPMPGAILTVHKAAGEAVKRGETIVTIESMKLQMALAAPRDGVIEAIVRAAGERFEKDEVIARLEPLGRED